MAKNVFVSRALAFTATLLFAAGFFGRSAIAQDRDSVFKRLRQLPDLGACPSNGASADPDLKKALTIAMVQARPQARDAADSVARMQDAGLASPDVGKQLINSPLNLTSTLKHPEHCLPSTP